MNFVCLFFFLNLNVMIQMLEKDQIADHKKWGTNRRHFGHTSMMSIILHLVQRFHRFPLNRIKNL